MKNEDINDIIRSVWPEWSIEAQLGTGSYGKVYEAVRRDAFLESRAAIKVISVPSSSAEIDALRSAGASLRETQTYIDHAVEGFVKEIQLMKSLQGNSNIVSVEDYKVIKNDDGIGYQIFIRMELLVPFNTYLEYKHVLPEEEVIRLGCDICSALESCGKYNIIHRDIKPENIFIHEKEGHFKLGDFGVARTVENMTGALSRQGTPFYMAPEVNTGTHYDHRADLYSLGLVLYGLLNNNRPPFLNRQDDFLNPDKRQDAIERRLQGEALPAPCSASPEMADLVLRACAFYPDGRFASAAQMKQALESVRDHTYPVSGQAGGFGPDASAAFGGGDGEDDPNKTVHVRHAPAAGGASGTVSKAVSSGGTSYGASYGRDAAPAGGWEPAGAGSRPASYGQPVGNFGKPAKKKSPLPAIAAVVAGIWVLSMFVPRAFSRLGDFFSRSSRPAASVSESEPETVRYSPLDQEQIDALIAEADALAETEDYEQALAKIKTGLVVYPQSAELQAKEKEYTAIVGGKIKLQAVEQAAAVAETGDYLGAAQVIGAALETIGGDDALQQAKQGYEDAYAATVAEQMNGFFEAKDLEGAEALLAEARANLPENGILDELDAQLDAVRPKYLMDVCPPYAHNDKFLTQELYVPYTNGETFQMGGAEYTNGFTLTCVQSLNGPMYAAINLGGNYSAFEIDIGHLDDTPASGSSRTGSGVLLWVYLDDELFATVPLMNTDMVQHYTLDVTGVTQLRLELGALDDTKNRHYTMRTSAGYGFGNIMVYPKAGEGAGE